MNESDEHARKFGEAVHKMVTSMPPAWNCLNCGKENQSSRALCWNCATKKDGTPSENPENLKRPYERSSMPDLVAETQMNGETKSKHISDSIEVRSLLSRYWDAYVVARVTVGLGEIIKVVGLVMAVLIVLASLLISGQVGGFVTSLLGIIGAVFIGGQFYLLGLIVMAQGQILKASLDSAVNSSPFLNNEHRAKIMSLK